MPMAPGSLPWLTSLLWLVSTTGPPPGQWKVTVGLPTILASTGLVSRARPLGGLWHLEALTRPVARLGHERGQHLGGRGDQGGLVRQARPQHGAAGGVDQHRLLGRDGGRACRRARCRGRGGGADQGKERG